MLVCLVAATLLPLAAANIDPPPAVPPAVGTMADLPGNHTCVSCNFFAGLFVLATEIFLVWAVTAKIASSQVVSKSMQSRTAVASSPGTMKMLVLGTSDSLGWLVALFGILYWGLMFATYFNFISYVLLIGPIAVVPAIAWSYTHSPASAVRTQLLARRVKLGGWLLAVLMLAAFTNVSVFPEQLYRHLNKAETTITPNDPLVLKLRDTFYGENPKAQFDSLPFVKRMSIVDEFIKAKVIWKADEEQYHVLGLLTSPHDVLTRGAGDCQGQSATTASLLFALGGVQAYCVETPFHWWTHAKDMKTGETYNLNAHGHAGLQGSVLPQPVDMIYTWYPPSCEIGVDNCTTVEAHNRETIYYQADPLRAFMTAMTGMHEFRRDILPNFANGKQWELAVIGAVVALVTAAYASYFQADLAGAFSSSAGFLRLLKRFGVSLPAGVYTMVMTFYWGYIYYPVVMIHLVGMICFSITFACNDGYNRSIGTPIPIPAPTGTTVASCCCRGPSTSVAAGTGRSGRDDDGTLVYATPVRPAVELRAPKAGSARPRQQYMSLV